MISILFVDDEINILQAIRNSLRKRIQDWHLSFAQSGAEALEALAQTRFDIVVSDMRMPGMDGAALLTKIQERYPHMTRFILTGQADRESILRAIPVTHQFLYKPCSPPDLLALLDRTCNLYERIQSDEIRKLVSSAKSVPSAPKTSRRIAELAAGGQSSLREIAALIEKDPGLAARVLQVSNSAIMGRSREVTKISEAISCLGLECAQALALANEVFTIRPEFQYLAKLVERTYEKAFLGATLAAQYLGDYSNAGAAVTATLLRDIGMLVSAESHPRVYKTIMNPDATTDEIVQSEIGGLGVTHAEIGGHLLSLWGTPMIVVEAVTCHHYVEESTIDPILMAAVHVADVVANANGNVDVARTQINWNFVELNQLESDVEEWLAIGSPPILV